MRTIHLETVQWASLKDIDRIEPIGDKDREVLEEIRQVIVRHGRADRFGVALLHKHFELHEGEVVMETTDIAARTSTLTVERLDARPLEHTIETLWRFAADGTTDGATVCVGRCEYDSGHRLSHGRR